MDAMLRNLKRDGLWITGKYKSYRFEAKVYDQPSDYGINGGRISKLLVNDGTRTIFNYDRGLDIDSPIGYELAKLLEELK